MSKYVYEFCPVCGKIFNYFEKYDNCPDCNVGLVDTDYECIDGIVSWSRQGLIDRRILLDSCVKKIVSPEAYEKEDKKLREIEERAFYTKESFIFEYFAPLISSWKSAIQKGYDVDIDLKKIWHDCYKAREAAQKSKSSANVCSDNVPKCPTCGSTNVDKIGGLERGASVFALGIFSKKINKTMKCKNCGYMW